MTVHYLSADAPTIFRMEREMNEAVTTAHMRFGESLDILKAFTQKPEPIDFVLPGLIAGTVGSIVSPGGAGKSMLALQLLTQLTGGPDLLKWGEFKKGKAVYFAAEDPKPAILHRLYSLGAHLNHEERITVNENLVIRSVIGKNPDLLCKDWIQHIGAFASESRLIVIDTLRRFHELDENSSSDMNQVVNTMDKISTDTGCAIIFIHHANKGAVYSGTGDTQQASRGSSVLVDNIRWQVNLSNMTKEEAKELSVHDDARSSFVRLSISKRNFGPPEGDKWLRRHEGGILKPAILEKRNKVTLGGRASD